MTDAQVPLRTKILFGTGSLAEHIALYSFGFFIMIYYNQVLGLPATLAGLGPTLALIVDAITDPLMGSWSDRFRAKKWACSLFLFSLIGYRKNTKNGGAVVSDAVQVGVRIKLMLRIML